MKTIGGVPVLEPLSEADLYTDICTVDWADLVTLDLSQFDVPGGKQKLANQLKDAVHNVGPFTSLLVSPVFLTIR